MAFTLEIPEKSYAGVIFDNDGTLADSMPLHYEAWLQTVHRQIPGFEWPIELFYSLAGMNVHETINRLNAIKGTEFDPYQAEKDKLEIFEQKSHLLEPIPPVVNYARELKARGTPIAVGTGAHRVDAILTLKAIGAYDIFDIIVTQEDVKNGKPDPETWLLCTEKMGVEPKDCLVLEDGELGIKAAHILGMDVVRIPHNWREV
jgi:HAD superfamily hydrolase (TIGR01509 family)